MSTSGDATGLSTPATMPAMRAFLGVLVLWTTASFAVLFFNPAAPNALLLCMRLVGRSAAREAAQAAVNDAAWTYHTFPVLAAIGAGYVAVVLVRASRWRRARRR